MKFHVYSSEYPHSTSRKHASVSVCKSCWACADRNAPRLDLHLFTMDLPGRVVSYATSAVTRCRGFGPVRESFRLSLRAQKKVKLVHVVCVCDEMYVQDTRNTHHHVRFFVGDKKLMLGAQTQPPRCNRQISTPLASKGTLSPGNFFCSIKRFVPYRPPLPESTSVLLGATAREAGTGRWTLGTSDRDRGSASFCTLCSPTFSLSLSFSFSHLMCPQLRWSPRAREAPLESSCCNTRSGLPWISPSPS